MAWGSDWEPSLRFLSPLIGPDVPISGNRLFDQLHCRPTAGISIITDVRGGREARWLGAPTGSHHSVSQSKRRVRRPKLDARPPDEASEK